MALFKSNFPEGDADAPMLLISSRFEGNAESPLAIFCSGDRPPRSAQVELLDALRFPEIARILGIPPLRQKANAGGRSLFEHRGSALLMLYWSSTT